MSKWHIKADELYLTDPYATRRARKTCREERRARNLHNPKRKRNWPPRKNAEHGTSII